MWTGKVKKKKYKKKNTQQIYHQYTVCSEVVLLMASRGQCDIEVKLLISGFEKS